MRLVRQATPAELERARVMRARLRNSVEIQMLKQALSFIGEGIIAFAFFGGLIFAIKMAAALFG